MSNIYKGLHIEMEGKQLRGLVNGRDGGPLICHESEVIFVFRYFVTINETRTVLRRCTRGEVFDISPGERYFN